MRMTMKMKAWGLALGAALLLTACGGSDSSRPRAVPQPTVTVIGDSLADVGVTGVRFTVQSEQEDFPLWPEHVAEALGVERPCPAYRGPSEAWAVQPDCRGFAVGGGRILHGQGDTPLSILRQLEDAGAAVGEAGFGAREVVLIDGGGNDVADLIMGYMGTLQGEGGVEDYLKLLGQLIEQEVLEEVIAQPGGPELAAHAYMQALAERLEDGVREHVLGKGARRVVILNMPDVTLTPRFLAVLRVLDMQPPVNGQSLSELLQTLARGWMGAFNRTLHQAFEDSEQVLVVDFYGQMTLWAGQGSDFGLTNTTDAVCPVKDPEALFPDYDVQQCTVEWLDANVPAGAPDMEGWWRTYVFADGFHPTPLGHELMARAVVAGMVERGWN